MRRTLVMIFVAASALIACGNAAQPPAASSAAAPAAVVAPRNVDARPLLAAHRKEQIDRLHAYALAGLFPHNPAPSPAPLHMFRDAGGRLCAVANLVHLDGHDDVVDAMAKTHNDVVVADQASGPLHDWVLTSGFTNEEVRRIQGAGFMGLGNLDQVAMLEASERTRLQMQLHAVEGELLAANEASLDLAAARLQESGLAMR